MGSFQRVSGAVAAAVGMVIVATGVRSADAQQASVLHIFPYIDNGNAPDGIYLNGQLAMDSDGSLYGTARRGGGNNLGTLYKYSASSGFSVLDSFDFYASGAIPVGGPILTSRGELAGVTSFGGRSGYGTVYLTANGNHDGISLSGSLPDGLTSLNAGLVTYQGAMFGTTTPAHGGGSTLYRVLPGAQLPTTLATFNSTTGDRAAGPLVQDAAGNIFGVTYTGGLNGTGTVFKFSPSTATISVAANFPASATRNGGLAIDTSGNVYGLDTQGIFEVNAVNQTVSQIATVPAGYSDLTQSLSVDSRGNLYGASSRYVFEVDADTHNFSILASAADVGGNIYPVLSGDIFGVNLLNGNLYGVTGGDQGTAGSLFEIALPEPGVFPVAAVGLLGVLRRRRSTAS